MPDVPGVISEGTTMFWPPLNRIPLIVLEVASVVAVEAFPLHVAEAPSILVIPVRAREALFLLMATAVVPIYIV